MTTQRQITAAIAEHAGLTRAQAAAALTAFKELVTDAAAQGDTVNLQGFGTFQRAERAARTGRNPHTGAPIEISASVSLKFRAAKTLTERLTNADDA
ncbi:HU family DNA-binding protein [Streptomyces sp. HD1123-B1]|uniref:HU family DNA-binding protein n=1 Tax=Streptomyces huangiella TaxID=3228804 RepID=UPI003D7D70A2